MEPIRIYLPVRHNKERKNIDLKECYLLLYEEHIDYKIVCNFDELDEPTGVWRFRQSNFRWHVFAKTW